MLLILAALAAIDCWETFFDVVQLRLTFTEARHTVDSLNPGSIQSTQLWLFTSPPVLMRGEEGLNSARTVRFVLFLTESVLVDQRAASSGNRVEEGKHV